MQFDQSLAEMFFGGYPIVVEGDTEYAAFAKLMLTNGMEYPIDARPLIVRARGKEIIPTIIRILCHFGVPFSVMHDSDSPKTKDGTKASSAWSANTRINAEVRNVRSKNLRVVHRISIPDFERYHGLPEALSDKPFNIWTEIATNGAVAASIRKIFDELISDSSIEGPFDGDFESVLKSQVEKWADENAKNDPRYLFNDT
jgi:hypothetical protein